MKKLADISAFTNLMNQSNSTPVQNGFMDKAKKALYPALVGGSLLGGGLAGHHTGYEKGITDGWKASREEQRIMRRDEAEAYANPIIPTNDLNDLGRALKGLERLTWPMVSELYSKDPLKRRRGKNLAKLLVGSIEARYEKLTPEQQDKFNQLKLKIQGTGLVELDDRHLYIPPHFRDFVNR